MSKHIVMKGLQLLEDSEDSDSPKVSKKKTAQKKSSSKNSSKWGLKKRNSKKLRDEESKIDAGRSKSSKLGNERKLSKIEKYSNRNKIDNTLYNLKAIKLMTSLKSKQSDAIAEALNLKHSCIYKKGPSNLRKKSKSDNNQSVFTEDDFKNFEKEFVM